MELLLALLVLLAEATTLVGGRTKSRSASGNSTMPKTLAFMKAKRNLVVQYAISTNEISDVPVNKPREKFYGILSSKIGFIALPIVPPMADI